MRATDVVAGGDRTWRRGARVSTPRALALTLTVGVQGGGAAAWTQLSPSGTLPGARDIHSTVYGPINDRLIIFGGRVACVQQNDVWVLSNAKGVSGTPTWTQLSPPGTSPGGRAFASQTYAPASNRMTVFGGSGTDTAGSPSRTASTGTVTSCQVHRATPARELSRTRSAAPEWARWPDPK